MAKKTVVKRAYKYWPKSDRLDQAIHHLNTDGGEGLATTQQPKPQAIDPQPIIDGVHAVKTLEALDAYWAEHNGKLANDLTAHGQLKKACQAHKRRLQAESANITDVEVKDAVAQS